MTDRPCVLVIGNCTVDLSFMVHRFPGPGETLLADEKMVDLGGKGANQAVAAHRFGARSHLAAPLGRDDDGNWALGRLSQEGVDLANILRTEASTDQSILYITPSGENTIVSSHGAAALATPAWAGAIIEAAEAQGCVLMQGNLSLDTTRSALSSAKDKGLMTILNPAPIHYDFETVYPFVDVLVVNESEAVQLGGRQDARLAAQHLRGDRGIGTVIVTLGSQGAIAFSSEGETVVLAPRVEAIDSVGAGDVFCGALASCLGRGTALRTAMMVAVEAASLAVTRRGTQSAFPSAGGGQTNSTTSWSGRVTAMSLSEEILRDSADEWNRMQQHRFVTDIEADRLPPAAFRRYLAYENQFVETAILIFGYMLVKAPDLETRQRLVKVLQALSDDQISYFRKAFDTLGMAEAEWKDIVAPPAVAAFRDGMLLTAAHGTYVEAVAAMFAAEWMYWTWCSRAARKTISDPVLREWVELHAAADFASQALWLRGQIDAAGVGMNEAARRRVTEVFRRALELEIEFHAAAYE